MTRRGCCCSTSSPRRGRRRPFSFFVVASSSLLVASILGASSEVFFAAAASSSSASASASSSEEQGGEDVPVTPADSALRPFGLYDPFENDVGGRSKDGLLIPSPRCSPRHVHLSLGDETIPAAADGVRGGESAAAAMTVSFSIPSDDPSCRPEDLTVSVVYSTNNSADDVLRDEERRQYARPEKDVRRYNATSDRTGTYYESDWIYHVQLRGLKWNAKYSYRIDVETKEEKGEEEETVAALQEDKYDEDESFWNSKFSSLIGENQMAATPLRRLAATADEAKDDGDLPPVLLASSPALAFRTSPPPGFSLAPTKVVLLGDLGQTYNSTQTMLNIFRETKLDPSDANSGGGTPASLVFCAGDMSYADTDQSRWDNWFQLIEPLISTTPLQVTAGNHEIECDGVTREVFQAYENRFRMPNPTMIPAKTEPFPPDDVDPSWGCGTPSVYRGSYDGGNAYYAFTYGPVRFVALSPYSDTALGSRQYRWLEGELRSIDRAVTPWLVVVHHTQFYTTFLSHNDEIQTTVMRQAMEPLFVRYGVNLVVSGHDHAYMRTRPMKYGASDPSLKSPMYVIVGEGGNREHHVKAYLRPEPEEWVVRRDRTEYGFGTLEVVNSTWARWRWVRDGSSTEEEAGDDSREGVTDDVWLQNQYFLRRGG